MKESTYKKGEAVKIKMLYLTIIAQILLFVSCELNVNKQPVLESDGKVVIETPAPWLINNALGRGNEHKIEINNPVVEATVYGNEIDPNIYLASGGEKLPEGSWVKNVNNYEYITHIKSSSIILLEDQLLLHVLNPADSYYLSENNEWVAFDANAYLNTSAIKTGLDGSCTVITTVKISSSGDDDLNE